MNTLEQLKESLPLLNGIKWDKDARDFVNVMNKPHAFIKDGRLFVSMEHGDNAGDYYGQYISESEQSGPPYINQALEAWADSHKGYWEWMDAGSIVFNQ